VEQPAAGMSGGIEGFGLAGEVEAMIPPRSTWWQRWGRRIGYLLLVAASIWGIWEFVTGDSAAVMAYWRHHFAVLPLVMLFAALDVTVEVTVWTWVYHRFGMRSRDRAGVAVGLSGKAGLLLPAQLGRLVRPDLMVRLRRGTLADGLKAEAVIFVLDATSVSSLLVALLAWRVQPVLAPIAVFAVIGTSLMLGNRILKLLSGTRFDLPAGFWWSWQTAATVCFQVLGWTCHGLAFLALASGLPGDVSLWDALFMAPGSAVVGIASGLPGGIGATEVLLGVSLSLSGVPAEHLALGVAAFRIVTFWMLIPVGWLALGYANRQARALAEADGQRRAGEIDGEPTVTRARAIETEPLNAPVDTSAP
jgi:uncharacterized membrane protein YbhN (UPF0104 family)